MKIKKGFMLRKVAGKYIVVAVGAASKEFNGLITLNETGCFLWKKLEKSSSFQNLLDAMLDEYDVSESLAKEDITQFIQNLQEAGILDD